MFGLFGCLFCITWWLDDRMRGLKYKSMVRFLMTLEPFKYFLCPMRKTFFSPIVLCAKSSYTIFKLFFQTNRIKVHFMNAEWPIMIIKVLHMICNENDERQQKNSLDIRQCQNGLIGKFGTGLRLFLYYIFCNSNYALHNTARTKRIMHK